MTRRSAIALPALLVALSALAASCLDAPEGPRPLGELRSALTAAERRARCEAIRDVSARAGITNGLALAGIAQAETGLAHCWSEATWACQGPDSPDCAGPVIAGAGDGACSLRQGGLGMFQFDAGTYDDTLAREGERILSLEGNIEAAVDFVLAMLVRSTFIDGVDDRAAAVAWLNDAWPGSERYPTWIQTVTAYYNGCWPGRCSVYESRYAGYDRATQTVLDELGEEFWRDVVVAECEPIPPEGRVVDETDPCFEPGGTARYWRYENAGWEGSLMWTHTTDLAEADNFGLWRLAFERGGIYRLEAYTDAAFARSRSADYEVRHGGVTSVFEVDQTLLDGWSPVGEVRFEAGDEQWVRLGDNSGEPLAESVRIAFDALRLTRLDEGADGDGDADADADADADGDSDGDSDTVGPDGGLPPGMDAGCGCRAARPGAARLGAVLRPVR